MRVNHLKWDSVFFNLRIGELSFLSGNSKLKNLSEYDLLYVKGSKHSRILNIDGFKKSYEETRIVFSKEISEIPTSDVKIFSGIEHPPSDKSEIYSLAYLSGIKSRFKEDPKFSEKNFRKLYRTWVDNSFSEEVADNIFLYQEDGKVLGLVTYSSKEGTIKIGLFAVIPEAQGKGIGTKLLNKVVEVVGPSAKTLIVETQGHNVNACNFYRKYGFEVLKRRSLKHYWRNDTI